MLGPPEKSGKRRERSGKEKSGGADRLEKKKEFNDSRSRKRGDEKKTGAIGGTRHTYFFPGRKKGGKWGTHRL